MSPGRGRTHVGNDVVHLLDPRCTSKHDDSRFMRRVFAPDERARILAAEDPTTELWVHWAAKEAAFKVVSKIVGSPPPFRHAAFRVSVEGDSGAVAFESHRVLWNLDRGSDRLHLVARSHPEAKPGHALLMLQAGEPGLGLRRETAAWDSFLGEHFTSREQASIHSASSALVRIHARRSIAEALAVDVQRLEIVCDAGPAGRTPPVLHLDGTAAGLGVTLSHDGPWIGWAWLSFD